MKAHFPLSLPAGDGVSGFTVYGARLIKNGSCVFGRLESAPLCRRCMRFFLDLDTLRFRVLRFVRVPSSVVVVVVKRFSDRSPR